MVSALPTARPHLVYVGPHPLAHAQQALAKRREASRQLLLCITACRRKDLAHRTAVALLQHVKRHRSLSRVTYA